ncbi:MAG: FecR domain-containing protein [Spirochaetales bacterium]|nr:FecR domain-containing protein [Spirochaetales bacterium]
MKKRIFVSILSLLMLGAAEAFAGKAIGQITYFSGDVSITRRGAILRGADIFIGDPVEDFDLIRTGAGGAMDLALRTPQKQQIRLTIQANTSFSIETAALGGGKERTTLQMMSGTLACKVDKLSGNELSVRTKSAAMGVKGTDFTVTTSPTDDLFVTCDEGAVSCVDPDSGQELTAEPGEAVELPADEKLVAVKVPADRMALEAFRQKWLAGRLDKFKRTAARHIAGMARLFTPAYNRLSADFKKLQQKLPIIKKWIDQDKRGIKPPRAELRRENRNVLPALLKIRIYLTVFEPLYFRLSNLEYYYSQGYGAGDPAVEAFFKDFEGKKAEIDNMLAFTRYCMRLYADRNNGYFPLDDAQEDFGGGLDDAQSTFDSMF